MQALCIMFHYVWVFQEALLHRLQYACCVFRRVYSWTSLGYACATPLTALTNQIS